MLLDELDNTISKLQCWVTELGGQVLDGADAVLLVERFTKLERLGAAGRALAARRVADTNGWKGGGSRSAADWVADKTKTSPGQASASLETTERLEDLPATKEAFTTGQISEAQAAEIASAAHADPSAEQKLLDTAASSSMSELRRAARAIRVAAQRSQLEDRERVHRSRYLRHWTTKDGAFEAHCRLTADQGALLLSAVDVEHRLIFEQAHREGRHESAEAYRADALVNLARNTLYGLDPEAPPNQTGPTHAPAAGVPGHDGPGDNPESPAANTTSPADSADTPRSTETLRTTAEAPEPGTHTPRAGADTPAPSTQMPCADADRRLLDDNPAAAWKNVFGAPDVTLFADHGADVPGPGSPFQEASRPGSTPPSGSPPGAGTPPDGPGGPSIPPANPAGVSTDAATRGAEPAAPPRRPRLVPTVTVRVDHAALVRGWTQPGEVCEVVGIGPIPVETARAYARGDAVIRALLVDGERVIDARGVGRTIPSRLRIALEERDRTCVVPGCASTRHLEIHHLDPFALGGETSLTNTCRICPYHHDQITYGHAELAGTPGHWTWSQRPPDPEYGPFDDPPDPTGEGQLWQEPSGQGPHRF